MATKPVPSINEARYIKALSHPLRVRILALLQERTASPRELAEWLDATLERSATTCARCTTSS
jgi:DNA-binding transcriptional ArsR family regulator